MIPTEVKMAYIDSDSLFTKYNFAKDVNEASQRANTKFESARQQKASEIQRFAAEMDKKRKTTATSRKKVFAPTSKNSSK